MKAVFFTEFQKQPTIETLPDPIPTKDGAVLKVEATGICRSDWHGWMGHDPDITLPHVPGHELAGVIVEMGQDVKRWQKGSRVTVPFVGGCGSCPECASGNHQVCHDQFQPGFTHWGSFAQFVNINRADTNLVGLPPEIDFIAAASLGCRFVTSFRAIVDQGRVSAGQWVAVHGCGGVGLSAVMIANALGANVVAVDINDETLDFVQSLGAIATVNAQTSPDVVAEVQEITNGGAHVSVDALGHPTTCYNSIANLRRRGKHIQVGLMAGDHEQAPLPWGKVIAHELEVLGSHGMQAHRYPEMLRMIQAGKLHPDRLVRKTISLAESIDELVNMSHFRGTGITVVDRL
ncbi:MAG: zinc-dependent alcohol dehydrogenase family protein [Chloroflexi bacterium]|nr:zinc-dependent alcohol dehydrogenase family protein [Chloroflexota bacterium]